VELIVVSNRIPAIIAGMDDAADAICAAAAGRVVAGAAARSRVATGEMQAGWTAERAGPGEYRVFNPVEHAIYNEFGTTYMAAQPMLGPALEDERPTFTDPATWAGLFGE
jgi:hypothetical protein